MTAAIELRDLKYSYLEGKEALGGITMTIGEGECVGLIGPNGSGKSTVLLHLNGVLPQKLGGPPRVFIMGEPVTTKTVPLIRQTVGLLFQDPDDQLFCPTVFEDVAFGPQQFGSSDLDVERVVEGMLKTVGLEGFEERSPHHLSGGEKQRVCLAGILACHPKILALDEPTSNLDPRGKRELKSLLRSLSVTKIIASHDLEMVLDLCSRAILLDGGHVIADGPTAELLANEELMLKHGLEKPHSLLHRHPHA